MNATTAPAMAACLALIGMVHVAKAQEDGASRDGRRTVTVSGVGKVSATPDVADISVGVVTDAPTAREALSGNNQAMRSLTEQLKARGLAEKDIQTDNISLNPRYSQPPDQPFPGQPRPREFTPQIVGYSVTNSVRIVVRDLEALGDLLDAVVTAGANQMNGISFRVSEPEALKDEARTQAVADARRKASQLCDALQMTLGSPVEVVEGGGGFPPPQPMMARAMMMAEDSVPISPGEQELSVSVQVVYEITVPE